MLNPHRFFLKDDGIFPNNILPVLIYRQAIKLPLIFPSRGMEQLFVKTGWTNNRTSGIFTYHHYHSITHEVIGVVKGKTVLQLGGEDGIKTLIQKGDIIVIPAGVAHKNLGAEKDVICVGGYPDGRDYDMNYGKPGERPATDKNIQSLPLPSTDPLYGGLTGVPEIWAAKNWFEIIR